MRELCVTGKVNRMGKQQGAGNGVVWCGTEGMRGVTEANQVANREEPGGAVRASGTGKGVNNANCGQTGVRSGVRESNNVVA